MWHFGWSDEYFSRITIFPLTSEGFAEGFVPEVGYKQGDNVSGEAYQPLLWFIWGFTSRSYSAASR